MKTLYFLSISLIFLLGCSKSNQKNAEQSLTQEIASNPVDVVDLTTILADPAAYDGKEVTLKGTVVHVCKHSGKRLHLLGSDEKT